jgi:hypothetical protein
VGLRVLIYYLCFHYTCEVLGIKSGYHVLGPAYNCGVEIDPIIIENPDAICKQLCKFSIVTITWWTRFHKSITWSEYPEACYLKNHVLALTVHQQLRERHIDYIMQTMRRIM